MVQNLTPPTMLIFYLVTLLPARILAPPTALDDALDPRSVQDDDTIFNQSALATWTDTMPTCYPNTDPVFFSLASSRNYNFKNCLKELNIFTQRFDQFGKGQISFWYSKDGVPPLHLTQPALQLPVFHHSPDCSFAIAGPKLMDEFARKENIPWRAEWGTRAGPLIRQDLIKSTSIGFLSEGGFISTMNCVLRGGQASYIAQGISEYSQCASLAKD